ncbi:hypothetical protein TSH7_25325 [Azospirillum sp. TSH7]|nr:hypothetical protein TSH7_25325 [Azospirillum sp. TSH7]PWC64443.1 hypothetical protein TSH20_18385 [Azospirillum sp. TSH20]
MEAADQAWRSIFAGLTPVFGPAARQSCFYILTISAEQLGNHDVIDLLKDRIVFYGTDLLTQHDLFNSSVFGQVAGVQAHAMAFDNLMTYGDNYFRGSPEIHFAGMPISYAELTELGLWMLMAVTTALIHVLRGSHHGDGVRLAGWIAYVSLAVILVLAVVDQLSVRADIWEAFPFLLLILAVGVFSSLSVKIFVRSSIEKNPNNIWLSTAFSVSVISVAFVVNETILHWDSANWFGFVLLYLGSREVAEIMESQGLASFFFGRRFMRKDEAKNQHLAD